MTQAVKRLHPFLWLWLPLLAGPLQVGARAIGEDFYRMTMRGESGAVENLTVFFLVCAVVIALRLHARRGHVTSKLFGPMMLAMAAGCFFFAGEEASWGQHWIGFETPDDIAARNEQGEFNLHNDPFLESILDQAPRLALTIAALIGGILAPLRRRKRGSERPRFDSTKLWGWVWPTIECLPAAVVVVGVTLPKKFFRMVGQEMPDVLNISPGETKEFALALFLFAYLAVMLKELRAQSNS